VRCVRILAPATLMLPLAGLGCASSLILTGTVTDQLHRPVPGAVVRVWGPASASIKDTAVADSVGRFRLPLALRADGCYRLQVRSIGFGPTERTFEVDRPGFRDLGAIPLRTAPIPETGTTLFLGCPHPGAGLPGGWGTDTIRVAP